MWYTHTPGFLCVYWGSKFRNLCVWCIWQALYRLSYFPIPMLLIFVQNLHEIIIITFISGEGPDIKYFTYVLPVGKLKCWQFQREIVQEYEPIWEFVLTHQFKDYKLLLPECWLWVYTRTLCSYPPTKCPSWLLLEAEFWPEESQWAQKSIIKCWT